MIKYLFISAAFFAILAFIIMGSTEEHLLSLACAAASFALVGIAVAIIENKQAKSNKIKGMIFNGNSIIRY